jgi:hypothetical protein
VPTSILVISWGLDPWNPDDATFVKFLQLIWDAVYGETLPHTVEVGDAVFRIVGDFLGVSNNIDKTPGYATTSGRLSCSIWFIGDRYFECIFL